MFPGLILSVLSGAIGLKILDRIMPDQDRQICLVPLQIGVGFAVLIPILNLFLVLHLFSPAITSSLILLLCTCMWRNCYLLIRRCFAFLYDLTFSLKNKKIHTKIPLMIIAFTFFWGIIGLGAPSTDYDSTVYHLTLPKLYSSKEAFVPRPDIIQSRYSQNLAGVRTLSFQWGGEGAVEFLNMITCALLLWLIVELLTTIDNKNRWIPLAAIIVCCSFQFIFYLYDANVEGWLAFLTLCLFTCVWLIKEDSNPSVLFLLGLLGGCLIGIKPTSSPPVILALILGFIKLYRFHGRMFWTLGLGATLLVIVLGLFWYVIVFEIYGNLYSRGIIGEGHKLISTNRLQLQNIWLSFRSVVIYNSPILIYLMLLPLTIMDIKGKEILTVFVITSLAIFITNPWAKGFVRYIFPIFPLTVIGIVFAFKQIDLNFRYKWRIFRSITIFFLLFSLLMTQTANVFRNSKKFFVCFRLQDNDKYLESRVNTYRTIMKANSLVPANGMLFMVGERSYWLDIPYVLGISRNPAIEYGDMTPEDFFELLKNYRVTHLLFSDEPSDKTSDFMKFWKRYPKLADKSRLELIYHDIWNSANIKRNSYLYKVLNEPLQTELQGEYSEQS